MKTQKVTKGIKLTIDREFLEKFERVKEYLGLENDAEVVRFLVNAYYRDVVLPRVKEFKSPPPEKEHELTPEEEEFLKKAKEGKIKPNFEIETNDIKF